VLVTHAIARSPGFALHSYDRRAGNLKREEGNVSNERGRKKKKLQKGSEAVTSRTVSKSRHGPGLAVVKRGLPALAGQRSFSFAIIWISLARSLRTLLFVFLLGKRTPHIIGGSHKSSPKSYHRKEERERKVTWENRKDRAKRARSTTAHKNQQLCLG
jgi:hypothetical protein